MPLRKLTGHPDLLEAIVENIPDMVFVKDAEDLRFVLFNSAGERLIGIPRADMYGKTDYDFFPRQEADFFTQKDREVLERGQVVTIEEEPLETANGRRWLRTTKVPILDDDGVPRYLLGISRDITEWKRQNDALAAAHDQLRASEARYRSVVAGMAEGVVFVGPDGVVKSSNQAAETILGVELTALDGRRLVDLDWQEGERGCARPLTGEHPVTRTLRTGEACRNAVIAARLANGAVVWLSMNTQPLRETPNAQPSAVCTFHDITSFLDAVNVKDEFVSIVSHELRTPLTSIHGAVSLLRAGIDVTGDEGHELLEVAARNSERLLGLINDLLDIQKLRYEQANLELARVDVSEVVRAAVDTNQPYATRHDVRFVADAPDSLVVNADRARLMQVLTNLLSNAAKHSPAGADVVVRLRRAGDRARVTVTDVGPGIPEHLTAQVFDSFFQIDSSDSRHSGGTGLGLTISRAIVEQHGGTIGCKNNEPTGAVFFFEIQLAGASGAAEAG